MQSIIYTNLNLLCKVLIVFFTPVQGIILMVALATLIDTIFGIWRAYKQGEKIKSKTLRFGFIPKLLSYVGVVMFVYASDYFILNEFLSTVISIQYVATKVIALVLVGIEVKSWDESYTAVKGESFIQRMVNMLNKFKNIKKEIKDETNKEL